MQGQVSSLLCKDHGGKKCIYLCRTCKVTTCTECVTSSHNCHDFIKLQTILNAETSGRQTELDNIKSDALKEWQDLMVETSDATMGFFDQVNDLDKELDETAKEFHKKVDHILERNQKRLKQLKTSTLAVFNDPDKAISGAQEKIRSRQRETKFLSVPRFLRKSITPRTSAKAIDYSHPANDAPRNNQKPAVTASVTNASLQQTRPGSALEHKPVVDSPRLAKRLFNRKTLASISTLTQLSHSPSVQSKFDLGCHYSNVACVGSGKTWVKIGDRKLQLVDSQGSGKDKMTTDFDFDDVIISPQGDIILSDISNNCITLISHGKLFSTTPKTICKLSWKPSGLCLLHNENIVVTSFDQGRVAICSMSGKVIKELENKLFKHPYRVAQNKITHALYIADRMDTGFKCTGKILALDTDNKVLYEYKGSDDKKPFYPSGLCTDDLGHILITDLHNHSVHIVDKDGHFLQYLLTAKQGLTMPYNIDVDNQGNAWVGEYIGSVQVVNYRQ